MKHQTLEILKYFACPVGSLGQLWTAIIFVMIHLCSVCFSLVHAIGGTAMSLGLDLARTLEDVSSEQLTPG